jgi:glucosamine kinase
MGHLQNRKMEIIADSGSTKTTWSVKDLSTGELSTLQTSGINPFYQDEQAIFRMLKNEFEMDIGLVNEIHFYGAGCANPEVNNVVRTALNLFFGCKKTEVESDLLAAARALCQNDPGIACILGTGSNSCYYNGFRIEKQVSPLGFILGDEGSGAVIGKRLLADILKHQLPEHIIRLFFDYYKTTQAEIMDNIYRQPFPNRYAARFTRFISENPDEPSLKELVTQEFGLFFRRNVLQYPQAAELPVHFTGSIAWYFQDALNEVAKSHHLRLGKIIQTPMDGLLTYHQFTQ